MNGYEAAFATVLALGSFVLYGFICVASMWFLVRVVEVIFGRSDRQGGDRDG